MNLFSRTGQFMNRIPKFISFTGRVRRSKFIRFIPIAVAIWLLAKYIDEQYLAPNLCELSDYFNCYLPGEVREGVTFDMIVALLLVIPFLSVMVRRLHDHDKSGWWLLIALTGIGLLPLLYWLVTRGDNDANRFG